MRPNTGSLASRCGAALLVCMYRCTCVCTYLAVASFAVASFGGVRVAAQRAAPVDPPRASATAFDAVFRDATLRVDYYRSGTARETTLSIGRLIVEDRWAGPRRSLVCPVDAGPYRVSVVSRPTGTLLYRASYASLFWEWRTVPEAKRIRRTFPESVSVPMPRQAADVVFEARDRAGAFRESARWPVDPEGLDLYHQPRAAHEVTTLVENGPPETTLDLAIVAEGYRATEMGRFRADAKRLMERVFRVEPFRSLERRFNIHLVAAPSRESGVDMPAEKRFPRTALECTFRGLGIDRYIVTNDQHRVRDVASAVPHDLIAILVNSERYGGGGIYRYYLTCTARHPQSAFVFQHEFGHLCAGLADEYYASSVTYENIFPDGMEPWEPNITRQTDRARLKWRDLVKPATPIPTPWRKARYDTTGDPRERRAILEKDPAFGEVGAFEGAGYSSTGIYRPSLSCTMFSSSSKGYCAVCRAALATEIRRLAERP